MSSEDRPIPMEHGEPHFEELAENLGAAVCETDAEGNLIYANPSMRKLFGYSVDELVERGAAGLIVPDELGAIVRHQEAVLRTDEPVRIVFRAIHCDGRTRSIEATSRSYQSASGDARIVTQLQDVTERAQSQASLEKRLALETLLADLSRHFLLTETLELDSAIRDALERLARVGEADRTFLICFPQHQHEETSFFEWRGPGVPTRGEPTPSEFENFGGFASRLRKGEAIRATAVADLSDDFRPEREAILAAEIRSYLLLPSNAGERLVGVLGMHCFEKQNDWPEPEVDMLRLMTDLLTTAVRQKRYETALGESEGRFRALAENSLDSICEISGSSKILYISPAYAELLGLTPDDLIGSDAAARVHEDDRARVLKSVEDALAGDLRGIVAYRTQHSDGSWLYIEASARGFSAADGGPRLVAVLRDVTERERNRLVLRRQLEAEKSVAELSRFFLDMNPTSIDEAIEAKLPTVAAIADAEHCWIYTLDPSEKQPDRLHLHASDELPPGTATAPPTQLGDFGRRVPQVLEGSEIVAHLTGDLPAGGQAERDDMIRRGVKSFLGIPLIEERRLIGFMGFEALTSERVWSPETITLLRLIAEIFVSGLRRERAHLDLERSRGQLVQSQKMEAVGTLAGGIAHDFNNHLAVMLGNARFVMSEIGEDPDLREALADLQRSAEHCAQLTRSLLAFSRRTPARVEVIELVEVLKTVSELVKPLIPSSIHLAVTNDGLEDSVRADPTQLRQVLVNLIVNARDAMPSGGRLTLCSRRRQIDAAEASQLGLRPGGYAEVSIRDTGEGMQPELRERIFEPFFTTKPIGQGTGLGLATAYGIVQQSQGVITVDSEPGSGSEFCVLLPRAVGAPEPDGPSEPEASPRSEGLLLVEDEPAVRRLLARILRGAGHQVIEAADGVEGLEAADRHGLPRLLVTDLVMPRMGGAELAANLQARQPGLPVLFLSGHAEPVDVAQWEEVQSARFLQKPFDEGALLGEVKLLLDQESERVSSPEPDA